MALLLKSASPTPSNAGSARSFQWDTETGTKVLRYSEVLQRGGVYLYRCATRAPRVTRTFTYGPGRAPLRLHLILYSIHSTAMSHSNTAPVRNLAPLSSRSSSLRCIGSRAPDCRTVLQNWQDKTPKGTHKQRSIMEHSPGLPQDTESLTSCSRNRAKMLLEGHLEIKCHSHYNKVIRLPQYSSANS